MRMDGGEVMRGLSMAAEKTSSSGANAPQGAVAMD